MLSLKHIYRPLALAIGLMFLNPSPADAARILLMVDSPSTESTTLQTALGNAGHQVTPVGPENTYALTPTLSNFDVVVHMNGATYEDAMPVPTQEALVQFVRAGGGFVGAQWLGFEESITKLQTSMSDLVLARSNKKQVICGDCTLAVVPGQENHPLMAGVPASFQVGAGLWDGSPKTFVVNPPTVLMKINTTDAVLVRQVDLGRVVNFTAAVNYDTDAWGLVLANNPMVTKLYVNAVSWVSARANSAPTAVIEPVDAFLHAGKIVTLNGSKSSDPDGNAMTYRWTLTRPAGSTAALSDPSSVMPTFIADKPGDYSAQLIVNDGTVDSAPVTVNVSPTNGGPTAEAGPNQLLIMTGSTVQLDGSNSCVPPASVHEIGRRPC